MNTKSEQKLFRRIHREFEGDIYFFCLTLLRDISDSEKAAKSVFETAYETFVPSANLQQLRRALYISAVQKCRACCEDKIQDDENAIFPTWNSDSTEAEIIYQKITALPYQARSATMCRYFADMTLSEIAEAEEVSEENVKELLASAAEIAEEEALRAALAKIKKIVSVPNRLLPSPQKINFRATFAIAAVGGILGLALVVSGSYYIAAYYNNQKNETVLMVSARPSPTKKIKVTTKPSPSPSPEPSPTPTPTQTPHIPKEGERPVISKLVYENDSEDEYYGSANADDKYLQYEYAANTITAKDREGNLALSIQFDEEGNIVSEMRIQMRRGRYTGSGTKRLYDRSGNILEETQYSDSGFIESNQIYEYNDVGLPVKITKKNRNDEEIGKTIFEYDAAHTLRKKTESSEYSQTESIYDEKGNLLTKTTYSKKKLESKYVYEYGEDGVLLKQNSVTFPATANRYIDSYAIFDKTGKVIESFTEYNGSSGNFVSQHFYDENNKRILEIEAEYYSNDRKAYTLKLHDSKVTIREILYDKNDLPVSVSVFGEKNGNKTCIYEGYERTIGLYCDYVFDEKGNILKCTYYDENGDPQYIQTCEYDASGNKIKEDHYSQEYDGMNLIFTNVFEYDTAGALRKVKQGQREYFYENGKIIRYTDPELKIDYEYDKAGNPTKKTLHYQKDEVSVLFSFRYGKNGKQQLQTCWIDDHIWYFDDTGRKIKDELCNFDGTVRTATVFEYNDDGYLIKETESNSEGALISQSVVEYNADYDIVKTTKTTYRGNGVILKKEKQEYLNEKKPLFAMELDQNGNLTKWDGTDKYGSKFHIEFSWIDEKDPVYQLYSLIDPSVLIP